MRKGFTLVELSIVLVIIGLLIGGILVARSMISTARIQSFVRQMQQYDIGVANFKTKYNSLPGDSKLVDPPGNGNGIIEQSYYSYDSTTGFITVSGFNEAAGFWLQMKNTGFNLPNLNFTGNLPSTPGTSLYLSTNAPDVDLPPIDILDSPPTDNFYSGDKPRYAGIFAIQPPDGFNETNNAYMVGAAVKDGFAGAVVLPSSIKDETALAIDSKMDDGNLITGNVHEKLVIRMLSQVGTGNF